MAHKKGEGSSDNGRDSIGRRLGVKLFGGEIALAGNIIVRQRGTRFHAGENVYMSKDFTLHAAVDGKVVFKKRRLNRTFISVLPITEAEETVAAEPKPAKPAKKTAPAEPAVETAVAEAPVAEPKAESKKAEKITLPSGKKITADDLKIVEGIGPKIEQLFHDAGISTWQDLANADIEKLQGILAEAGSRYQMHDPATWAKQAQLAVEGKWDELQAYQDSLKGGKEE